MKNRKALEQDGCSKAFFIKNLEKDFNVYGIICPEVAPRRGDGVFCRSVLCADYLF